MKFDYLIRQCFVGNSIFDLNCDATYVRRSFTCPDRLFPGLFSHLDQRLRSRFATKILILLVFLVFQNVQNVLVIHNVPKIVATLNDAALPIDLNSVNFNILNGWQKLFDPSGTLFLSKHHVSLYMLWVNFSGVVVRDHQSLGVRIN